MADDFTDHFKSKAHMDRVERAAAATTEHLRRVATNEENGILNSMSEAMGQLYGIASFYKALGLNHQGEKVFEEIAAFIGK